MKFLTTYISLIVDSIDNTISAELPLRAANVVGIMNIRPPYVNFRQFYVI